MPSSPSRSPSAGCPHVWDGEELVVPEEIEAFVDALFDELEAEIGPFPVPLLEGDPSTEFGLDEWPLKDLETLKESLIEAEIPHLWQGVRCSSPTTPKTSSTTCSMRSRPVMSPCSIRTLRRRKVPWTSTQARSPKEFPRPGPRGRS